MSVNAARTEDLRKPRFPIFIWGALSTLPKRRPLVKGLLDQTALSVIYGASNSAKTFVAIDLVANIARGDAWRGRRVEQGAVIYLAAEGGLGIKERFDAFAQHHGIDPDETPLFIVPASLDMCSSATDTNDLIADIEARLDGEHVVLVIVDTLSRVMAGGNENGPDDMGAFVANCDRLRQALNAHVAVIHHTGKDEARGARGHSLLRAAADTEIEITRDEMNVVTATVTKQRDHKSGDIFAWRLEGVELGKDADGDPATSCALSPIESERKRAKPKTAKLPNAAKIALDHLHRAIDAGGEIPPASNYIPAGRRAVPEHLWRAHCYEGSISAGGSESAKRKAFARSAETLQSAGLIGVRAGWVWLCS